MFGSRKGQEDVARHMMANDLHKRAKDLDAREDKIKALENSLEDILRQRGRDLDAAIEALNRLRDLVRRALRDAGSPEVAVFVDNEIYGYLTGRKAPASPTPPEKE
ncbi:hypothetical protein GCM10007276_11940 [Agaricicola taiwanensis]|uniref:Uncharacterized protein n=1 Tax=Agaricicola taiwanensis TaxID=591372 RepID=A0A8J2VPM2_9RHOB|nr:hypothetical protein [Agaricicola taiwanensis]GGE36077.1 hypothetical protein GCM10007276_11940 [Agaricicola taiwanensis]